MRIRSGHYLTSRHDSPPKEYTNHQSKDSLAILAPFVDVGLLIEKDYADKCALDYVEEKDLLNILTLCLFGKMADSTDLNERNKRNRKVKLEPPQAMVMVASINALLARFILYV